MPYENNEVLRSRGQMSDAELDAVEADIGMPIPPRLREHYKEYNGGALAKRFFATGEGDVYEFHQFLSMKPSGKGAFEQMVKIGLQDPGYMPKYLLPFADDPGGASFCMGVGDGKYGQIFFYDSEQADNEANAVTYLAPSLDEFIESMRDDL